MLKRFALIGVAVGALALAPSGAQAATITGTLNIAANAGFVIGSSGAVANINTATALDFTSSGAPTTLTPGVAGDFIVTSATGSFGTAGIVGFSTVGKISDFTFTGTGSANYPVPPVNPFQMITSPAFTFTLTSIVSVVQTGNNFLGVTGVGTMTLAGFDPTPGIFSFSTQDPTGGAGVFSFSATDVTVPEPGSMLLLGSGLLGLGASLRRRFRKA